jgi:ubiquinone/menaquinone biosynthesis C-methylase UbiE
MPATRTATDVLAETVDVAGRDVLDVGCGAGELVRWLRSHGARAVGVECGLEMRRRAIEADPEHAGEYVDAVGQDLPFDDGTFDVVVFSYSLHHVPIDQIPTALREARRVLRPGGILYVVEPDVEAPDDAVAVPVIDERIERAAAQSALDAVAGAGFEMQHRFEYLSEGVYADFAAWERMIVGIDPDRAAAMAEHREHLSEKFHQLGEQRADGWVFLRNNLLAVLEAV